MASVPLFRLEETSKARLKRIGVIDVGSNSVRLVVFDGMARSPAYFYNEKMMCALGAGLSRDRAAEPQGLAPRAGGAAPLRGAGPRMGLPSMIAVATAAVREAEDGPAFFEEVERETGLQLQSPAATRRRGCRRRGCCSAGRTPTGWSATWAAPRWSSRGSADGGSAPASPRRSGG